MISNATPWMYEHTLYNGVATQSLRFDDGSSAYLSRTFSSGNRKTWTWSGWVKRSSLAGATVVLMYTGSGGGVARGGIVFNSSEQLEMQMNPTGSAWKYIKTNALHRDTSAWYHIVAVLDTTQATESNRQKFYVNGTEQTLSSASYPTLNQDYPFNLATPHTIGSAVGGGSYLDGYLSEVNFVDGLALDPTYFGETKNGVWIAKNPVVSEYGTNGFRLQFDQVGVGTASTSTIGADTSGKTNHLTSSGIVASDCDIPDSPENNWCVGNAVGNVYADSVGNNPTYSEGNLEFETAGNPTHAYGTMAVNNFLTNGCYFEVRADALDTDRSYIGIVDPQSSANEASYGFVNKALFQSNVGRIFGTTDIDGTSVLPSTPTNYADGNIVGVAVKGTSVWFHVNGTYSRDGSNNLGNPSTGANPTLTNITNIATTHYLPYAGYNSDFTFNFGQDSSFAGAETAQGNTDANGNGDFYYAVPTGFLAMCSANMEEPTIGGISSTLPTDYFNTVLYTGNGSPATHTLGFRPNLVWGKRRNIGNQNHWWINDVTDIDAFMSSDTTDGEATTAGTTFNANGSFTTANNDLYVNNGSNYVVWAWKAGGTTTTNDASATGIGSQDSVYQANTTAGFSIVTYTGTGSNDTFAHGVQVNGVATAPNWIIHKRRDSAQHWVHYHVGIGNTRSVLFNTDAQNSASAVNFNNTSPTSTVFSLGTDAYANASGGTYVAYCFAEVEGYSKFGSYTGNGNADGTFVYTGFRPAWVLIKKFNASGTDWMLVDSTRDTINPVDNTLFPSGNTQELDGDDKDFVSNGFKHRSTGSSENASGDTYIYMAFAEAPFKYANAR